MNIFLKPFDPALRKNSKEIPQNKINSLETKEIIQLMVKIIQGEQKKKKKGVGLAAPQIGILRRIILVDLEAGGKRKTSKLVPFINPEIIWKSKKKQDWYEGCFSTGNICGIVSRSISIIIRAFKLKSPFVNINPNQVWVFEPIEEKYTGYIARIFQHEIDHLNGKLFAGLITNPHNLHKVKKDEFPLYRNKEAWRNWPRKHTLPLVLGKLKQV